jgi:glutamyl-tRNA reductase
MTKTQNDLTFAVIGINHKTAPIEIREQVVIDQEEQAQVADTIAKKWEIDGILILSTCNRSEIYLSGEKVQSRLHDIREYLNEFTDTIYFMDDKITYIYENWQAVRHFIRVTSSLDSQVVGEPQITGQVKQAYQTTYDGGSSDTFINKLFNFSLKVEKQIRRDTFLTDGAVSVSFAAVELAKKIFSALEDKKIMLIGAGETAELAAKHFIGKGAFGLTIANRTFQRAQKLAGELQAKAVPMEQLEDILLESDIVITATGSRNYILTDEHLHKVCHHRNYKPIFLIDLGMPRDIDPKTEKLDGVFLYNLDDLNEIVAKNVKIRLAEIPKAEKIIEENLQELIAWHKNRSVAATIANLTDFFESLRSAEFDRLKKRLPSDSWPEVEYLTKSMVNKILHQHIKLLKGNNSDHRQRYQLLDMLNYLYEFDTTSKDDAS